MEDMNFKIFAEKEIQSIYDQHVKKDQEYFFKANKRYENLSDNEKEKWFERDFPRQNTKDLKQFVYIEKPNRVVQKT